MKFNIDYDKQQLTIFFNNRKKKYPMETIVKEVELATKYAIDEGFIDNSLFIGNYMQTKINIIE